MWGRNAGSFGSKHRLRAKVVPKQPHDAPHQLALLRVKNEQEVVAVDDKQPHKKAPHRLAWGKLLGRIFDIDIRCECGGKVRLTKAVTDPDEIEAFLCGARGPPEPKPRPSPPDQLSLFAL